MNHAETWDLIADLEQLEAESRYNASTTDIATAKAYYTGEACMCKLIIHHLRGEQP